MKRAVLFAMIIANKRKGGFAMRRTIGRIANGPLNGTYIRAGQRGFAAAGRGGAGGSGG